MVSKTLTVRGSRPYDIHIGSGLLAQAGEILSSALPGRNVCIVADENVAKLHLPVLTRSMEVAGFRCHTALLPPGEGTKSFSRLESLVETVLAAKPDRQFALIALGGGVVGDIVGFAASIILRGIPFVQVPTTLLAQVDSSVGGKTGINTPAGKNLIGAFHQPAVVLADLDVLRTLPPREVKAGYAEIVKYGLINDVAFFDWLEKNGAGVLAGDAALQAHAIEISCAAKAAIVAEDEKEQKDVRALLNLGHTFGHALEALGGYDGRLLHGEAVGIGLALAAEFSREEGLCPAEDVERLSRHLSAAGMMAEPPFAVSAAAMLDRMRGDKKARDGKITLVLLRGIGQAFVARDVDEKRLSAFLRKKFG